MPNLLDHTYAKSPSESQSNPSLRDHDYCVGEAHLVNERLQKALQENEKLRAKVSALQKQNSKAKQHCSSLRELVSVLKKKGTYCSVIDLRLLIN